MIKTDNRMINLREATNQQNQYNRGIQSNNKSGIKGVSWNKAQKNGFLVSEQIKSYITWAALTPKKKRMSHTCKLRKGFMESLKGQQHDN